MWSDRDILRVLKPIKETNVIIISKRFESRFRFKEEKKDFFYEVHIVCKFRIIIQWLFSFFVIEEEFLQYYSYYNTNKSNSS